MRHDDKIPEDRAHTGTDRDRPLRHALEFRHPSYASAEGIDVMRRHGIACVLADTAGRWPKIDEDTADFRYVRLHGDRELYASGYTDEALGHWSQQCRRWAEGGQDVFVYFDNDVKGHAPYDALRLLDRLRA